MKYTLKQKFALFYVLIMSLCFAAFSFVVFHSLGYRINRTSSLPGSVYRIIPLEKYEEIKPGDRVVIDLSRFPNLVIKMGIERGYVYESWNQPMLKRIGAVPGDTIELRCGFLFVNGSASKMTVASQDMSGRELKAYPTPITLQPGYYWLVSDPEQGFDSRYFGPVIREAITHKAEAVL